jgi:hypothetical protein
MNAQIAQQLYEQFKTTGISEGSKQMLIGFLKGVRENHRLCNRKDEMKKLDVVLGELKMKPENQKDKLI